MLYPVLLDPHGKPEAVLEKAYDFQVRDQLLSEDAGFEVLQFRLPGDDPKQAGLQTEKVLQVAGRQFVIRVVERGRDDQGLLSVYVEAEATWYDLGSMDPVGPGTWTGVTALAVMADVLAGTGWAVGDVELKQPADFVLDQAVSPLAALRLVPSTYGGELFFDTAARTVHLRERVGADRDVLFALGKNLRTLERREDTRDLVTRLYPYGANNLTIAAVNGGVPYLEDYSYFDQLGLPRLTKVDVFRDERITNPYYLKTRGLQVLALRSRPRLTLRVAVLADVPDLNLGDRVWVYDPELGVRSRFRVSQRTWYPLEPWRTELQLEQPLPTLAEALARPPQPASAFSLAGAVTEQDMQDLGVFNYLLNSRAEQGLAYWQSMGFTVEAGRGVTGSAAFRCDGAPGQRKELRQVVYPANRDRYMLSLQADLSGLQLGPAGRVGVEVTFRYRDGTQETKFYPIT